MQLAHPEQLVLQGHKARRATLALLESTDNKEHPANREHRVPTVRMGPMATTVRMAERC